MKLIIAAVILFTSTIIYANESNSYNQNIAIQMASRLTSDDRLVIYPIHEGVLFPIASAAIMEHLESAKKHKLALAILGPSYEVNYDSYKYAITNAKPGQYAGVRVIFIGDKDNFEELTTLSEKAGISFKATTCCSK